MDASADIAFRIGVRIAASLIAFAVSSLILHLRKPLKRPEVIAAAALFCGILAIDAAVFLAPVGSTLLPASLIFLSLLIAAGAFAAFRAGLSRAVALAAAATVIRIAAAYILLEACEILVK